MLAASTVGLGAEAAASVSNPVGTWTGSYQGRPATLVTDVARKGLRVTLYDHAMGETRTGHATAGADGLTDVTLRGGGDEIFWRALRLHRWLHDPASGADWWTEDDNPHVGLSLYRDPSRRSPAVAWHSGVEGRTAEPSLCVFDGTGDQFLLHLDRL